MEEEDLTTVALGRLGEQLAAEYLEAVGYKLVAGNFTIPVGRNRRNAIVHTEIDIVAYDGPTLCFIEVKTRASDWFATPAANVDLRKQRQVARAARAYRRLFGLTGSRYRFDVISVTITPVDDMTPLGKTPSKDGTKQSPRPRIELLKNYWRDDKFRKRNWVTEKSY